MKKVAFICIHNSCRSQMAEAFARELASDVFEAYSAGTEERDQMNQDAVRLMKEHYNIDMELEQHPKLTDAIPAVDVVITMGCGVHCPWLQSLHREDWGLEDPTGKEDAAFIETMRVIREKVLNLKERIASGHL